MPRIQLTNSSSSIVTLRPALDHWFRGRGFMMAVFEHGKARVMTDRMGEFIVFKLTQRPDHGTYYKEAHGGALIVFEIKVDEEHVSYAGYCPLLLFGFWEKRLRFKQGASGLFSYRDEGHRMELELVRFLRKTLG